MDHSQMDHSKMDHSKMNHSQMDHSKMDHSQMVHEQIPHPHMDNSQMGHMPDHSAHEMGGMDHSMMKMYFHGGYEEVILFDFWRIDTLWGLLGSMLAVFVLGVAYEAIKFLREYLFRKYLQPSSRYNALAARPSNPAEESSATSAEAGHGDMAPANPTSTESVAIKTIETSMLSTGHALLTLLHMVQVTLAYLLMLVFMTYNSWLCLAVILGFTAGYFFFGWRKMVVLDEPEHCH